MNTREIYCCGCGREVAARLTDGVEIYPHRDDLYDLPFWKCDTCENFVGCHHKTKDRTRPLGCIPTPELKRARMRMHALIDPVWQDGKMPRGKLYAEISKGIGREYHTAETRSVEEVDIAYAVAKSVVAAIASGGMR